MLVWLTVIIHCINPLPIDLYTIAITTPYPILVRMLNWFWWEKKTGANIGPSSRIWTSDLCMYVCMYVRMYVRTCAHACINMSHVLTPPISPCSDQFPTTSCSCPGRSRNWRRWLWAARTDPVAPMWTQCHTIHAPTHRKSPYQLLWIADGLNTAHSLLYVWGPACKSWEGRELTCCYNTRALGIANV